MPILILILFATVAAFLGGMGVGVAAPRIKKVMAAVAVVGGFYLSYQIGRLDGEGVYFGPLRKEMNPFLRDLGAELGGTKKAAVKHFLLRADDIKLEPADYLKDLKGARELLKNELNQPPQRNAGSRPFSSDSPASETPSSLGPRG